MQKQKFPDSKHLTITYNPKTIKHDSKITCKGDFSLWPRPKIDIKVSGILPISYWLGRNIYTTGRVLFEKTHEKRGKEGVLELISWPQETKSTLKNHLEEKLPLENMKIGGKRCDEICFKDITPKDYLNPRRLKAWLYYGASISNTLIDYVENI